MKKLLLLTLIITLLFSNFNCGGGVGSSNTSGKTMVNISIGKAGRSAALEEGLSEATPSIPSHIASIRFTISAPDIVTIRKEVSVTGKTFISETFEILNGTNRRFLIEALDVSGNALYRHTTFENLEGEDIHLNIDMEPTDKTPPEFKGLTEIKSIETTSLTLSWETAIDDVTIQDKIQYLIYRSNTPEGEDFASPDYTTTGATSFDVTGLNPATTYYFVVRAKDETGNIDKNTEWKIATTLIPPDTTAPTFDGVESVAAVSSTEMNLTWSPAKDDRTVPSNIVYNIYMSTTPGGKDPESPHLSTERGATSYTITGLSPATTYYFIVRAKDEAGNIDSNPVEMSATTLPPDDITAPSFNGVGSVIAVSSSELSLSWSPAVDNVTATSKIIYNIYMSDRKGVQNLVTPTYTTTPGSTSMKVTGLSTGATYYFIVRAEDEAGNEDGNLVEKSAATQYIDLTVDAIYSNICTGDSCLLLFTVTVSNSGNIDAFSIPGYYVHEVCSLRGLCFYRCDPFLIPQIEAQTSVLVTNLTVPYNTNYLLKIDPGNQIPELNETNNEECSGMTCTSPPLLDNCVISY